MVLDHVSNGFLPPTEQKNREALSGKVRCSCVSGVRLKSLCYALSFNPNRATLYNTLVLPFDILPSIRILPSAMPFSLFCSAHDTIPITVDAAGWLAPFFLLVLLCATLTLRLSSFPLLTTGLLGCIRSCSPTHCRILGLDLKTLQVLQLKVAANGAVGVTGVFQCLSAFRKKGSLRWGIGVCMLETS